MIVVPKTMIAARAALFPNSDRMRVPVGISRFHLDD
jgi:hypothetical protein